MSTMFSYVCTDLSARRCADILEVDAEYMVDRETAVRCLKAKDPCWQVRVDRAGTWTFSFRSWSYRQEFLARKRSNAERFAEFNRRAAELEEDFLAVLLAGAR